MCEVSEKIKFCTCKNVDVESLKHFWVLYRFEKDSEKDIMGEPVLPTLYRDANVFWNQAVLEERLNENDAFDFEVKFRNRDKFVVHLSCGREDFTYSFIFRNSRWKISDEDPFDIINNYREIMAGKSKSPFRINRKKAF